MKKTQILIVEDEGLIAKDLQSMLRRLGYDVPVTVGTGDMAIKAAAANCPDLILMDIQLRGGIDGVQAAEAIAARQDIPIVYLTANSDEATLQRAKITDPFGFMIKPFEERSIQAGIEIALYKHRTERQNHERERWLATTLKSIADAVVTTDPDGKVLFMNKVAEALSGWTQAECLGRPYGEVFRLVDESTRQPPSDIVSEAIVSGNSRTGVNHSVLTRRDGSERHIEFSVAPIRTEKDSVTGCVIVYNDVSERRQMESELRQSQKMDAVGRLAGSIAHDFNNAITTVMGYSSLLMAKLDFGSQLHTDASQILRAAEHSARLTRQLLLFSRKQAPKVTCLTLNMVLIELQGLLRRLIRENIILSIIPANDAWCILGDAGHLEQLVINMAVNARDAMPKGGSLTIQTTNVVLGKHEAETLGGQPGEFVCLEIIDNGTGIPPELLDRIFEPFFTTKDADKGTGLGLSTCEGIVKNAGGFLHVESKMNVGTSFRIFFPRVTAFSQPAEISEAVSEKTLGGSETILIVEDEEVLRLLAARMLGELGYSVLEAENGIHALKVLQEIHHPVDLVVTDVIMPEMSGRELVQCMKEYGNSPAVLFMSGYTADEVTIEGVPHSDDAFLQKPFTAHLLARKVREILDSTENVSTPPLNACISHANN